VITNRRIYILRMEILYGGKMKTVYCDVGKEYLEKADIPDGNYVNVNLKQSESALRSKNQGLDVALDLMEDGVEKPLVLYSFLPAHFLFTDKRFRRLMSNEGVHFLRMPLSLEDFAGYLELPAYQNPALALAAERSLQNSLLGKLRHDFRHRPEECIAEARNKLGLTGSDERVTGFLTSRELVLLPKKQLGSIPGVFCDVDGTLLLHSGEINQAVVDKLIGYSQTHPITIWTGGSLNDVYVTLGEQLEKACRQYMEQTGEKTNLHLRTPLLPKELFSGSKPEIVIDDLSEHMFKNRYGMEPGTYILVKGE